MWNYGERMLSRQAEQQGKNLWLEDKHDVIQHTYVCEGEIQEAKGIHRGQDMLGLLDFTKLRSLDSSSLLGKGWEENATM